MIVFGLLTALVFGAELAAWLACELTRTPLPAAAGWALYATVGLLAAAAGVLLLDWLVLTPLRNAAVAADATGAAHTDALARQTERRKQVRHDLRGALSPAMLVSDRLLNNADPAVRRAGEIIVRAIERASALLDAEDDD